jgi:hypothetical protein
MLSCWRCKHYFPVAVNLIDRIYLYIDSYEYHGNWLMIKRTVKF